MKTYLLTWHDHDLLMEYFPCWMADNFPTATKTWSLGGCHIVEGWQTQVIRWHLKEIYAYLAGTPTSETAAG